MAEGRTGNEGEELGKRRGAGAGCGGHTWNLSTEKMESEFKATLSYIASSRPVVRNALKKTKIQRKTNRKSSASTEEA